MVIFDNAWYAEMIERFNVDTRGENVNHAIDGHGRAILAAASIIASAIDELTKIISVSTKLDKEVK